MYCVCVCGVDCRENVLLQGVYHPGLFVTGKWSCCDHRSKYSQGCTASFCGNHQEAATPTTNHLSPSKTSAGIARGPLPPTPADGAVHAPLPPPHSSRYHESHGPNPNTIQSYEHHDLNPAKDKSKRGGGGAGGGVSSVVEERSQEPLPPPVPVSIVLGQISLLLLHYILLNL